MWRSPSATASSPCLGRRSPTKTMPSAPSMPHALGEGRGGRGQIVGVVGEPGVGKSRLCYECKLRAQSGCLVLETFSVSHSKAYPYLPLLELLKTYFQITPQDEARRRREQVTGKLLT